MHVVLIYSGGLDSTVLLHHLRADGHHVRALSINYGQRHGRELEAAALFAKRLGIEQRVADLRAIAPLLAGSSLTSGNIAVPEGHYEAESMKATVVPNRNMLLLALATAWAISLKADCVAYGAHGGDHAIYPDCRPEFADAMARAIGLADWHKVELIRPFVDWSKATIVRRGVELGVPFADTWSCYVGHALHCGRCGTCIERRHRPDRVLAGSSRCRGAGAPCVETVGAALRRDPDGKS
jgi:7-cyano-7-deazaguanine synthase